MISEPLKTGRKSIFFDDETKNKITELVYNQDKKALTLKQIFETTNEFLLKNNRRMFKYEHFRKLCLDFLTNKPIEKDWSYAKRNCDIIKQYRNNFCINILKELNLGNLIINLDESGFSKEMTPKKVWRLKNKPFQKKFGKPMTLNTSLLAAISNKGFVMAYTFKVKLNELIFNSFLNDLNDTIDRNFKSLKEKAIIVMDNHPSHLSYMNLAWINNNELKFYNSPSYSSQIIPVEYFFGNLKYNLRRLKKFKHEQITSKIINYLITLKIKDYLKVYCRALNFFTVCLCNLDL